MTGGAGDSFHTYRPSDADEMTALLAEAFTHRDPPAVAVGLTPPEFESFVRLLCPKAADEGHTIVARSSATGEMIGALLTEDAASAPAAGMDRLGAKFDAIFDILGQLDADYRAGRTVLPGECLHLFLLGVAPQFTGRGVAQGLVAACLAQGAGKNYRTAITEATNKTSQHVFRKLGFVERARRSYQDHRFNGRACFETIADQGGPILMEKPICRLPGSRSSPS